jgi:biopolymer transport protein ExbD
LLFELLNVGGLPQARRYVILYHNTEADMTQTLSTEHSNPLADLNTTPLIDVLLVLLVMFIITIPIQTHAVKIDLPSACASCPTVDSDKNTITIDPADRVAWNGTPISLGDLRITLLKTRAMDPQPEVHLLPDSRARYGKVDEVLAEIKRARVTRFGFVGNEAHRDIF